MGNSIPMLFGPGFKDFDKFFVGFEDTAKQLQTLHADLTKNIPNYPPYNIRKNDENSYTIEIAVAGFGESEIDIEIDGGKLIVKGNVDAATDALEDNFLFKGIATRAFTRAFAIDDHIEVKNAEMFNGMLKIALERLVPEEQKPKKVKIKTAGKPQVLNEGE
jgi:molecular chaperone IbpA